MLKATQLEYQHTKISGLHVSILFTYCVCQSKKIFTITKDNYDKAL